MDYSCLIKNYIQRLKNALDSTDISTINKIMELLICARDKRKQIFIMGNGGSGATASHIAGDFNKGLSLGRPEEKRYKFISLTDNLPTLLSLANDVSYDDIFLEQLKNFLMPDDIVICISGSGNSENVLRAASYAKNVGSTVIGFAGYDGGKLINLADVSLHISVNDMQIVEDLHMIVGHLMMSVFNECDP